MKNRAGRNSFPFSHRSSTSIKGPLLMLAAAFVFAVLDGLIKVMGPAYRVWDLAFLRWGGSLALLSAVFAGFTVCLIKKLRDNNGPVVIYLYFCLLGAVVSFPMFIAHPVVPESGQEWLMAAGIAGTAVTGQLLMNQGFKYCKSWEGSMYLIAEVVFTAFLGIVFLGELINWHFWAGGILILFSVISLQLTTARQMSGA